MSYFPNSSYAATFTTQRIDTGGAANADSTPSCWAIVNGSQDINFILAVSNIGTGQYSVTGAIPSNYTRGTAVQVVAQALVNGVRGYQVVSDFVVSGLPISGQAYP